MAYRRNAYNGKKSNSFISIILVLVVALAVFGVFGANKEDDDYTRVFTTWRVGELDSSDGEFTETSDMDVVSGFIKYKDGVKIEVADNVSYSGYIYAYDADKNFIAKLPQGSPYNFAHTFTTYGSDVYGDYEISYIRIILSPSAPDQHVGVLDTLKIASSIKIWNLEADE